MRTATLLLLLGCMVSLPASQASAAGPCAVAGGLDSASATCQWIYVDYVTTSSSGDGHTWVVSIKCANGGICADQIECAEAGETGFLHDVYMDGTDVGDVCVPGKDVDKVNIAKLIIREFKKFSWPASDLVVQPPGGRTLVNLETNFYTLNTGPTNKAITVADQAVEIRATPTTYTFNFGDGTSTASATPGRPHPNLDITHVYEEVDEVGVNLDTTYSGEYRIGDGEWVPIADTVTVLGATQELEIVEAVPQLVIQ